MYGIDLVEKLAEQQQQYADAHRPARPIETTASATHGVTRSSIATAPRH
jgi:hypothetical protein